LNDQSSQQREGFLFVLEGIDGSGKSSACVKLRILLESEGYNVVNLREPTNESKWGKEIRARSPLGELTPIEELELFIRDRDWHVRHKILPALKSGKVVLLDRYFFATGAYQSGATGVPWQEILKRNREEIGAPEPDIIFILDIDAEVGLARATGRENKANLQFEKLERLVKVREAYLEIAEQDSGNFKIIDATKSLDAVVVEIHQEIIQTIKLRNIHA
jgi:dTMP kinase